MQTDQIKELQAKLASKENDNQLLQDEISRLNGLLIDINKKLEDSEKFKTHFISNVTNELINPFTSIIGLSQSILYANKQDWKKIISMVALIHSETFSLELQLKNILNAARIEAGLMDLIPERTDISHLLDSLRDEFQHVFLKRKIGFEMLQKYSPDRIEQKYFTIDGEKLFIILSNLLDNALKFSTEDTKIFLESHMLKNKLEVKIIDMGIGIPEDKIEVIFNRFTRLDNEINSIQPGQGLGLSICKGIVDLYEGEIKVTKNEYDGATFTLIIPEQNAEADSFTTNMNETFFDMEEIL